MKKKLTIAVDFDGTLCNYAFPQIGEQSDEHKELISLLKGLRVAGHKLILYTCRGNNQEHLSLTEAIAWCLDQGLEFDSINENIPDFQKKSGPSPKPVADIYLDDKALNIKDWRSLYEYK